MEGTGQDEGATADACCHSPESRSYLPVEAVMKALELLKLVNALRVASISDLHKMTGFAKPTIVRMLETLMGAGYVTRDKTFGGYRVTANVQNLSNGYFGAPMVIEAAHPFALELTHQIKWAVGVGMLETNHIRLQFSTASHSPWAMPMSRLRMQLDLCTSSMGRSYLAFCPSYEREALIRSYMLRYNDAERASRERKLQYVLKEVRARGYALKARSQALPNTQTLSAPIRHDGRVLATLGVGYFRNSVPEKQIDTALFQPIRDTIEKIEASIASISEWPQQLAASPPLEFSD